MAIIFYCFIISPSFSIVFHHYFIIFYCFSSFSIVFHQDDGDLEAGTRDALAEHYASLGGNFSKHERTKRTLEHKAAAVRSLKQSEMNRRTTAQQKHNSIITRYRGPLCAHKRSAFACDCVDGWLVTTAAACACEFCHAGKSGV